MSSQTISKIREDLIVDCIEGRAEWELLTWDEIDLIEDRIHNYIASSKRDTYKNVHHSSSLQ